ncbi:lipid IV(A) 3-deoxy-D-manno-octulosonic acid transferase [Blochmannia endosymbiont of Camponotus (Colobopsis) obliquus]|uniref:lipid IV(A) 3-deoxy-D-manno-octulosonic acid transferase n=1 Tax=Blochmannia endosymbiont of Camponotus (Colobopsis) obliquus TaxID=1505597 RepID=UPI00061A7CD6|nr:lipid IV(A) 3-deoxy-D-manno-octulosonic acid transferase [Blochmannia endosymbiont of Camponotus (Colobopsis) obliquus]AKC60749.1 3-deoxy-D-manno-octulosonic acid transferase [Blochmannia endosymbiont of Camponotus (Colobopsis) obliquus]
MLLYNILVYLIQPLIWIRLLWRSRHIPAYRHHLSERYGFYKQKINAGGIILHSVSIGETLAAIPLIHSLQKLHPYIPITVTSMTPTGIEQTKLAFGNKVFYGYLPYDLPGAINRFINHINPILVITIETELWPNLIKSLYRKGIPFIIANARLSLRSAKNYQKIKNFMAHIMQHITLIAAQYEDDGARFISLGLKTNQLAIIGNLKFEISVSTHITKQAKKLRKLWNNQRPIWIAASTHYGEEKILLKTHHNLLQSFPNLLMILAPRHPERFSIVQQMIKKSGFNYILQSSGNIPSSTTQIVINDTMGKLMLLYGIVDVAFIGGSLIKHGGHNPLEAAAHGIPIIMGPYTFNFQQICIKLKQEQGLITITDSISLTLEIFKLLNNKHHRLFHGNRANKFLYKNQGALKRLLCLIEPYLNLNKNQ